ncbi:MAG TPA: APC family permease [Prolixibacteraceae bacterium]|nr:APC family permease [Prolixibacteraceae bacterium]
MNSKEGLKREIGTLGLSANIINLIVGAGIFVIPAIVAEGLGAASIVAYLFCGFLIMLIMLCFAEVGSKLTQSGGAYSYIEVAFGKYFGFLTVNFFILGATIMADAAVANALAGTIAYFIPVFKDEVVRSLFFVFIFTGLALINIKGVKQGIMLVVITTILKLTPLLLLVFIGFTKISMSNLAWDSIPSTDDLGKVSLILFFAFQGAESALNTGGEVKNPQKTFPKGILISISFVIMLYVLIQLVAQGILGGSLSSFKEAPLAEVARHILGPFGVTLILVGAAISMFGFLSGDVLNMPRVIYSAARDKVILPLSLAKVHKKYSTPHFSIILYAAMGCFFSITGEFKQLAILSSASVLLIYLGVALAFIKLRLSRKAEPGTFRVWGGYTVPAISILIILWVLSKLTTNEIIGIVSFVGILSVIYLLMSFLRRNKELV